MSVAPTPPQPTLVPNEVNYDAAPTPEQRRVAHAVITLTALVTLVAFALIFYRSVTVSEPTSAVVVEGDASFDGTEILVTSTSKECPDAHATLNAENKFKTPVLLHPGIYSIVVTHRDRVLVREAFRIEANRGLVFSLPARRAPGTQPAAAAAGAGTP